MEPEICNLETITPNARLLGAHMPCVDKLPSTVVGGHAIGCTAVQLFTGSPKQWGHPPLEPAVIEKFHAVCEETQMPFVCAHDSYLINLAAPDPEILEKSLKAFARELERSEQLGLSWVVSHMGAHLKKGETEAYARLIDSVKRILDETDKLGYKVGIAMETTAGQGTGLGWQFEQIAQVLEGVGHHPRLGVCLDTCHIFVAGYDLREPDVYAETWRKFDSTIGLSNLKIIHANDAKKPLGSRVDRHDHLGEGEIGEAAFQRLLTDPKLAHLPFIVETPDSDTMHAVNVQRLRTWAEKGA